MQYEIKMINGERKASVDVYHNCNLEEITSAIRETTTLIAISAKNVGNYISKPNCGADELEALEASYDFVAYYSEVLQALREAKKELESYPVKREVVESENESIVCEKVGDWSVSLNREAYEKDPHTIELKNHRYWLDGIYGTHYSIWDSEKKERFEIKGEKHWEKWSKEHKEEYCTDF